MRTNHQRIQPACALIVVAALACGSGHSAATDTGEACAAVSSDAARLECYDLLFKKAVISPSAAESGKWQITEEVSLIDDSKNVFLSLLSEKKHRGRFGQLKHSTVVITCRENTTSMWVSFAGQFMSDNQGGGRVTYRIDNADARTKEFRESNSNEALGLWSGRASIPFIKEFLGASTLLIRATPYNESAVTATFDIRGLPDAIAPLRESCGW